MGRNFVFGCVLVFLFSTQNQLPQIIIEMGRVICHIEAFSVQRDSNTIIKFLKNCPNTEKNRFTIFDL